MTDDERKATEWLDGVAATRSSSYAEQDNASYAATLKSMLARPVLPEEHDNDAILVMFDAALKSSAGISNTSMIAAYRALYAHLSAPRTKEMEVWRVEYVSCDGYPKINTKDCKVLADDEADRLRVIGCQCIRVTGPHKQQVPA